VSALDLQTSAAMLGAKPAIPPAAAKSAAAAGKAAKDFEAVFINEMLGTMFEGLDTNGPFGGGPGEEMFRSLMIDQYAKSITQQGGFGLSAMVKNQILQLQETPR
jgi:Rod binding domain-containing protein